MKRQTKTASAKTAKAIAREAKAELNGNLQRLNKLANDALSKYQTL